MEHHREGIAPHANGVATMLHFAQCGSAETLASRFSRRFACYQPYPLMPSSHMAIAQIVTCTHHSSSLITRLSCSRIASPTVTPRIHDALCGLHLRKHALRDLAICLTRFSLRMQSSHTLPALPAWMISPVKRSFALSTGHPDPSAFARVSSNFVPIILKLLFSVSIVPNSGISV